MMADGEFFKFPGKPYAPQVLLMKAIYAVMMQGRTSVGMFEAPTGSGKTLAVLCSILSFLNSNPNVLNLAGVPVVLSEHDAQLPDFLQRHSLSVQRTSAFASLIPPRSVCRNHSSFHDDDASENSCSSDEDLSRVRVIYSSRTHSQLNQVAEAIRSLSLSITSPPPLSDITQCTSAHTPGNTRSPASDSKPPLKAVVMGARRHFCINEAVLRAAQPNQHHPAHGSWSSATDDVDSLPNAAATFKAGIGEASLVFGATGRELAALRQTALAAAVDNGCRDLGKRCPHRCDSGLRACANTAGDVADIESLVAAGVSTGGCPYYASRRRVRTADFILTPYTTALIPTARAAAGVRTLANKVVVVDEAHNTPDALSGAYEAAASMSDFAHVAAALGATPDDVASWGKTKDSVCQCAADGREGQTTDDDDGERDDADDGGVDDDTSSDADEDCDDIGISVGMHAIQRVSTNRSASTHRRSHIHVSTCTSPSTAAAAPTAAGIKTFRPSVSAMVTDTPSTASAGVSTATSNPAVYGDEGILFDVGQFPSKRSRSGPTVSRTRRPTSDAVSAALSDLRAMKAERKAASKALKASLPTHRLPVHERISSTATASRPLASHLRNASYLHAASSPSRALRDACVAVLAVLQGRALAACTSFRSQSHAPVSGHAVTTLGRVTSSGGASAASGGASAASGGASAASGGASAASSSPPLPPPSRVWTDSLDRFELWVNAHAFGVQEGVCKCGGWRRRRGEAVAGHSSATYDGSALRPCRSTDGGSGGGYTSRSAAATAAAAAGDRTGGSVSASVTATASAGASLPPLASTTTRPEDGLQRLQAAFEWLTSAKGRAFTHAQRIMGEMARVRAVLGVLLEPPEVRRCLRVCFEWRDVGSTIGGTARGGVDGATSHSAAAATHASKAAATLATTATSTTAAVGPSSLPPSSLHANVQSLLRPTVGDVTVRIVAVDAAGLFLHAIGRDGGVYGVGDSEQVASPASATSGASAGACAAAASTPAATATAAATSANTAGAIASTTSPSQTLSSYPSWRRPLSVILVGGTMAPMQRTARAFGLAPVDITPHSHLKPSLSHSLPPSLPLPSSATPSQPPLPSLPSLAHPASAITPSSSTILSPPSLLPAASNLSPASILPSSSSLSRPSSIPSQSSPSFLPSLSSLSPFVVSGCFDSIIPPSHVLPVVIPTLSVGEGSVSLQFTQREMVDRGDAMLTAVARLTLQLSLTVHGGVVVFASSSHLRDRLGKVLTPMCTGGVSMHSESSQSAQNVEGVLAAFRSSCRIRAGFDTSTSVCTGSILLCTIGGRLSEGVNFADEMCRALIILGIPLPPPDDYCAAMRMIGRCGVGSSAASAAVDGTAEYPTGGLHPADVAMRVRAVCGPNAMQSAALCAVNQTAGRAVRHKGDYAAIIYADQRYMPSGSYAEGLSTWITKRGLRVMQSSMEVMRACVTMETDVAAEAGTC